MIGKVKSRSLDMESNLEYDFQHTLYQNNEESKKKNNMNERVYFTLYELSRKQQGTSFLVETQLQQWKNKRERKNRFSSPFVLL